MKAAIHRVANRFRAIRPAHLKHPVVVALSVFFALVVIGGGVLLFGVSHHAKELTITPNENHIVLLNIDGATRTLPTNAADVGELLDKLNIKLAANDRVEPDTSERITQDRFRVNVYRGVPVHIVDGATTYNTVTAAATPRSMVTRSGVKLYPEDSVAVTTSDNFVLQPIIGLQAVVTRATPVSVTLYGAPAISVRTQTKTVADFIKDKKIVITAKDTVKPALSTPITPGMQIDVIRDGVHTITVTEEVPPPVQTVTDPSLSIGATAVRQAGSAGRRVNTYEINVQKGEEVSRKLLQSVTTVDPVQRVVAIGTAVYVAPDKSAVMAAAGISPSDYGAVDYIVGHESGWCPTKLQGTHVCPATAPAVIPGGIGYGLGQATPGGKMASAGADWATNPVTQLRWATGYASRYGGWQGAYRHWITYHWW